MPDFEKLPSGNGEPEIWVDRGAEARACWADRSAVLKRECFDTPENKRLAIQRHRLDVGDVFDLDLVGNIVRASGCLVLDSATGQYVKLEMLWCCPTCECTDVQGTAWVHLNSNEIVNGEPPHDENWCPQCEDTFRRLESTATLKPYTTTIEEHRHR